MATAARDTRGRTLTPIVATTAVPPAAVPAGSALGAPARARCAHVLADVDRVLPDLGMPQRREGLVVEIIGKLDEAGAGPEERQVVERELANPISTDALVREVRDQQTAEQVYLASALAIEPDTEAERSYLQYLAARLKLEPQRAEELHRIA